MFKTRRDVDRHVSHILNKIRDEKERNVRGYQFAKLYYDVADYESGKRYLQAFLSVRETVPQAHKLMGQIQEALNDNNKAIESYRRCLDLDQEQQDVILKVCELYAHSSVRVNADIAKVWIEKAEKYYPNDLIIFKLKEKIIENGGGELDFDEMEGLISEELAKNPSNVQLHIKLMQLYVKKKEVERAFAHAIKAEKTLAFLTSVEWYESLIQVLKVYNDHDEDGTVQHSIYWTHKLFALCSLASLKLKSDERDIQGTVKAIQQLDEGLFEADRLSNHSPEWSSFLVEMKGQLFYLIAVLLMKKANKGHLSWKDCRPLSAVCFLLSHSMCTLDRKSSWFAKAKPDWKKFYGNVYMMGCDRLSQGGHLIKSLLNKVGGSIEPRKLRQRLCTVQGRDNLFTAMFTGPRMAHSKEASYLMNTDVFTTTELIVPSKSELHVYDADAFSLHAGNLHNLLWLALQHYSVKDDVQPDYEQLFGVQLYPNMNYSMADLTSGDPSTLCQLDMQVFLYVCVYWAAHQGKETRRNSHVVIDKPDLMPVSLCPTYCTKQQAEWWTVADHMQKRKSRVKLPKAFGIVTRGLETIRGVIPNALTLPIVVHIAKTLDSRAQEIQALDAEGIVTRKLSDMQNRAAFYWSTASDMIDRMDRNQQMRSSREMLFPNDLPVLDPAIVKELREQVKLALAIIAMKEERFKDALAAFETIFRAEAAYYTGLIYRKLADSDDINSNESASDTTQKVILLLGKAKEALFRALDRMELEKNEELKLLIKQELDGVISKLVRLESGGQLEDSVLSYNNETNVDTDDEEMVKFSTPAKASPLTPAYHTPSQSYSSTRISPRRLDVQLNALELCNTGLSARIASLEESRKTTNDLINEILAQLRLAREEVKTLQEQVHILSLQGLSSMSMMRSPATPQPPIPRINPVNMPYTGGPPLYDMMAGQAALPPHMAQYNLAAAAAVSPRPGSAYGQHAYDESFANVDPELYDPEMDPDYYAQDQNLVQEWPFGHKAGVEGKSTITYTPQQQQQVRAVNPANAGVFHANALRGPSIQYGTAFPPAMMQPPQPPPSQLPGPGYFSQNNQQVAPAAQQTQAGMIPGAYGMMPRPVISAASGSPAAPPRVAAPPASMYRPVAPMMPPNAVIPTQSLEAKPKLIAGSVGVPAAPQAASTPIISKSAAVAPPSAATQALPGTASAASLLSNLAAKHKEETVKAPSPVMVPVASTPQKTVVKGFSFTTTPTIAPAPAKQPEKEQKAPVTTTAESTPKPFSGFSFTTPTKPTPPPVTVSPGPANQPSRPAAPVTVTPGPAAPVFQLAGTSAQSFGALVSQGPVANAFNAGGDSQKGFLGAGTPLFGKSPSPRRRNMSAGSDDHVDEYEPNVDFKPVIQLPDLIEVKTGEEEEEKLFCERAKLFRFDTDTSQWKERGIGEVKILHHRENNAVRILMRREQVLKICANHKISGDMKLTPMSNSDKAWVWNAMDFADGEMKPEKLAIKFKNSDIAAKFKKAFEKSQADIQEQDSQPAEPEKQDTEQGDQSDKCDLASLFKAKPGSWTCNGCYVSNGGDVLKCPCCQSLKPGVKAEDIKSEPVSSISAGKSSSSGGFVFGGAASVPSSATQSGSGFKFASTPSAADSATPSGSGFTFGSPAVTSTESSETIKSSSNTGGFKFGSPAVSSSQTSDAAPASLKFGSPAVTSTQPVDTAKSSATSGGFKFGTPVVTSTQAAATSQSSVKDSFKFGPSSETGSTTASPAAESGLKFGTPAPSTKSVTPVPSAVAATSQSTVVSTSSTGFVFGGDASSSSTSTANNSSTAAFSFGGIKEAATSGAFIFGSSKAASSSSIFGPTPSTDKDATPASSEVSTTQSQETARASTNSTKASGVGESLLARFLSSPDSWKCTQCQVSNDGIQEECDNCSADRPDDPEPLNILTPASNTFQSSFSSTTNNTQKPAQQDTSSAFIFGQQTAEVSKSEGYQFTPSKSTSEGFKFTFNPTSDDSEAEPPASLGSGFHFSMKATSPIKSPGKHDSIRSPKSPEINEEGYYVNKEGDDCHIHFEPVIELPDHVEVKTGEEEEEAIFSHRAKLFRFTAGEWKERGLGDMKVLYNSDTNKARILMRREQIFKLCCNHYITPELSLKPMPNSKGCALVWYAMDFADEEPKSEQFSVKFKTEEIANEFDKAIEEAKGKLTGARPKTSSMRTSNVPTQVVETVGARESTSSDSDAIIVKVDTATPEEIARARELLLPDHFFLYQRRDNCPGCLGCRDELPQHRPATTVGGGDEVGSAFIEDDEEYDEEEEEYETDEDDTDDEDDDETEDEETAQSGSFLFGGSGGPAPFSFASVAQTSQPAFSADPSKPFQWEGAGNQMFGRAAQGDGSGDEGEVTQGDDPHFEPVVPLPDLVEVRTGEENETVQYSQRSKLFRYDSGAWKEKGIGEMKILKHKETGKYRLLMRREQVHKLACNHLLTPEMIFKPMNTSETSWCWTAQDYSDSEPKIEQLAIKFKNEDLARTFKQRIDAIQAELAEES